MGTRAPGVLRRGAMEDKLLSQTSSAAPNAAAKRQRKPASSDVSSEKILERILASLEDDKAEDVVAIDLRGKSAIADHMVIASGRSSRQVISIAEKLAERMKQHFGIVARLEGKEAGDWVLIDAGDAIVHVFRPEVREFYQLEKMWMPAGSQIPGPQNAEPAKA
jgi:ribosome-associated protein